VGIAGGPQVTEFTMESQDSRFRSSNRGSFDPAGLWERVRGDAELLRELVVIFSLESPRLLERIGAAIAWRDFAHLENFSHKLKGSALQLSGTKAAALAASLERLGVQKSLDGPEKILSDLQCEIAILTHRWKPWLPRRGGAEGERRRTDDSSGHGNPAGKTP
jgi:HPt (histidine-containing phosphotransfer) domain-containing protein